MPPEPAETTEPPEPPEPVEPPVPPGLPPPDSPVVAGPPAACEVDVGREGGDAGDEVAGSAGGDVVAAVVAGSPQTSENDTNAGGTPGPHFHASTSPSWTRVAPAPTDEYVYDAAPPTARKYAQ